MLYVIGAALQQKQGVTGVAFKVSVWNKKIIRTILCEINKSVNTDLRS